MRRAGVLAGWFGGLGVLAAVLHRAGGDALQGPDLTAPGSWSAWAAERTPPEAVMAVLRLLGIGLAWYLLAATALGLAAHLVGGARSVALADLIALPFVRGVVQAGLGVGLVGAVAAGAGARGALPSEPIPTAADVALTAEAPAATTTTTTTAVPRAAVADPVVVVEAQAPPPPASSTWTIRPGDHLWSVAERVLGDALGRPPSDAEVEPYWRRLVEHNRHRVPQPDLVHAGLTIELPEPLPSRR